MNAHRTTARAVRARSPWAGVVAALLAVACGTDPVGGGERALEEALATSRGEVSPEARVWGAEPPPLAGASPHRMTVEASFSLRVGDKETQTVTIARRIDRRGDAFRIDERHALAHPQLTDGEYEDGREAVFDGRRFATRRKWSPWIERDTLYGGHATAIREAYGLAEPVLTAYEPWLRWVPVAGEPELAGLPVRWSSAQLDPGGAPPSATPAALAAQRDNQRAWPQWLGATHRPQRVVGSVAHRVGSSEVVALELKIEGTATVEGKQAPFTLTLTMKPEALPEDADLALPDEVLPARRPRPWQMVEEVLGDALNPIYVRK